jgi:hypothetical protein
VGPWNEAGMWPEFKQIALLSSHSRFAPSTPSPLPGNEAGWAEEVLELLRTIGPANFFTKQVGQRATLTLTEIGAQFGGGGVTFARVTDNGRGN